MRKLFTFMMLMFTGAVLFAQINTFPYLQTFDSEPQCGVICGNPCVLVGDWTNDTGDTNDWTADVGGTGSLNTGPSVDHTTGTATGTYLYTETSSPCFNVTANLVSPFIDLSNNTNMRMEFWYHMWGGDMGTMHVDVSLDSGATWTLDIVPSWTDDVDLWQLRSIDLTPYVGDSIQIRIRGIAGPSFESDMAVDDIRFYELFPIDAGVSAFNDPALPISAGLNPVAVTITNYGADTLFTADVGWSVNGATQTPVSYSDTILSFDTDGPIALGTFNFPAGVSTIRAWTSMPNGVVDQQFTNDTLEYTVCTSLAGVYTIGGVGADFATITDAVNLLVSCGVSAPTTFNIAPGTYNENMELPPIIGASATNTITFDGGDASTTTITWGGGGGIPTIGLLGADYITVKNLTIENTGTTDAWGVKLNDTADFNTIDSCIISMDPNTGVFDVQGINASASNTSSFTEGQNARFLTISNNTFLGGEMAIHLEGQNANRTAGNRIINNIINSPDDYGIYLDDQDSVEIIGNVIFDVKSTFGDGIYCFDLVDFRINENQVINVPDWGLYIADGNFDGPATLGQSEIINNMVSSQTDYAIYLDDVNEINVWHNSTWGEPGFRINDFTAIDVRNNVFQSTGDFAFESDEEFTFAALDYNIYYTPATNPNLIDFGPTTYPDLASWQTAFPTININSLEGDPGYVSQTDLHIAGGFGNDQGDNTVGVTVDIDGQTRPQAPSTVVDMGADEFTPQPFDVGVTEFLAPLSGCGLSDSSLVTVTIRSFGIDTVFSFDVSFELGGVITTETVTDTLLPSATYTYTFTGIADLSTPGATYTFNGWDTTTGDGNALNDSTFGYSVTHEAPLGTLPITEDFETWTVGNPGSPAGGWTTVNSAAGFGWHVEDANGADENSQNTGPFFDNTFFNQIGGVYMFTETSSGSVGDRYELISPCIDLGAATNLRLEYAYHMWGAAMGSLEVDVQVQGTWINLNVITGQQQGAGTDPWLIAQHDLTPYSGEVVRIRFVGVRGTSFTSDLAIDDIRIFEPLAFNPGVTNIVSPISGCGLSATDTVQVEICNAGFDTLLPGYSVTYVFDGGTPVTETMSDTLLPDSCGIYTFTTPINAGTPATVYTLSAWTSGVSGDSDTSNDSTLGYSFFHRPAITTFPYSQDFENGGLIPLDWEQEIDDGPQDWSFITGATPTAGTGPIGDHTTGNGYYAYVEDNDFPGSFDNDSVSLVTPCFDISGLTNGAEFSFWYHSNEENAGVIPSDVNELHIDLFYQGDWIQDIILPIEHKNNAWNPQSIDLTPYPGVVAVRFRVNNRNGNDGHDIAIDDILLTEILPQDAGIIDINSPNTDCGLSASEPLEVNLRNFGSDTIFSVDVLYTINGGTPTTVTINDTIPPFTVQTYNLGNINLSVPADYTITAYTVLFGDTNNLFDTTSVEVISIPNVTTYPYFEDFESGTGGWRVVDQNGVSTWELGLPQGTVIDTAFSGVNAWMTDLDGNYNNNDQSAVVGPCFDFSTLGLPIVEMAVWWDTEFSWDGAVLQSSTDSGATWVNVGALGDPDNWYNDGTINGAPGGSQEGWSGTGPVNGSGQWLVATNTMPTLAGEPDVQLRVAFGSDGSGNFNNGFAFDDFTIRDTPPNDMGVAAQVSPPAFDCGDSTASVEVTLINYGTAAQTNVPVVVNVGGAGTGTVTGTFPGPINPGDTVNFVVGTFNTYAGGNYTFTSYTSLPGDGLAENDTTFSTSNIDDIPLEPIVFGDSACQADSLLTLVATSPTDIIAWYDSAAGGVPIAIGDTFLTPFLSGTTTYYAQAGWSPSDTLTTTFAGGNGQAGNMFDLTNNLAVPVVIDSIAQHIGSTTIETVEIYYVTGGGTYVGKDTDPTQWTLLGTATVTAAGIGQPTYVPIGGLVIPPGQTYGIYVTLTTSTNIDYTTLTAITTYTNGELTVEAGLGKGYPFAATFSPRGWNGQVFYSGANCASDRVPVQAIISAPPPVDLGPDAVVCAGFPIDATTPGVVSYLWNTGETTPSILVDLSGTYYVDVIDINGCPGTDTINMTILPSPTVLLGNDTTVCGGITLDAGNAGATYIWQDGSMGQTLEVTQSGQYFVTATLSGCPDTDTINVTVLPAPTAPLGADIATCQDVTLDAGNAGSTYLWSTGETTQTITVAAPAAADTVSVTITGANGCDITDEIVITPGTDPIVDIPAALSVCGDTILDAGNPGATYLWSTGETTQTITVDESGTYDVTVTDGFGCVGTASVDVTVSLIPDAEFTFTNIGFTYTFMSQDIPGATYEWDFGDGSSGSTDQNPVFTYLFAGSYTITLTITNECGTDTYSETIGNVSLEDDLFASKLIVSPNPNDGRFFVISDDIQAEKLTIEVSDLRGRIVWVSEKENVNGFREQIDITSEAEGVYMLHVSDGEHNAYIRIRRE